MMMRIAGQHIERKRADGHDGVSYSDVIIFSRHQQVDHNADEPASYNEASDPGSHQHDDTGGNFNDTDNHHKGMWSKRENIRDSRRQVFVPVCEQVSELVSASCDRHQAIRPVQNVCYAINIVDAMRSSCVKICCYRCHDS